MIVICIKQHLSKIWSSIHEKVKQHWGSVEKKALFIKNIFSVTQSFLLHFSWSFDNTTASNKKSTSKKEPTSVSEITI